MARFEPGDTVVKLLDGGGMWTGIYRGSVMLSTGPIHICEFKDAGTCFVIHESELPRIRVLPALVTSHA